MAGISVTMTEIYLSHGIRFRYPAAWEIDERDVDGEVTITVSSPGATFWTVSLYPHGPEPAQVMETALKAYRDEFKDLDVYPVSVDLCQRTTTARDLDFVCLDLIHSGGLRTFRTGQFTVLVLFQSAAQDDDDTRNDLDSITDSLRCEGDELIFST